MSTNQEDDGFSAPLAILAGVAVFVSAFVALPLWLAGQVSGVLDGSGWPDSTVRDAPGVLLNVTSHAADPAAAWPVAARAAIGPPWMVWALFVVMLLPEVLLGVLVIRGLLNWRRHREFRLMRLGFASGIEVRRLLSARTVLNKAKSVRPSVAGRRNLDPREVGFFLGHDRRSRRALYGSVEDVMVIVAPPRQGKDVHLCAPFTIDAPGPVIVTSTRADAFTNTYASRSKVGKVYVFDPNNLTYWPERLRWSPVHGCEKPLDAANRAMAMMAAINMEPSGDSAYYFAGASSLLRWLFHAAALGNKTIRDVQTWCVQQINPEPIAILRRAEAEGRAAVGWASSLEAYTIGFDPKHRSVMFSVAVQALGCFDDPGVMECCSPGPEDAFDVEEFLSGRNTLYVLGKDPSVAPVVTALMESLFENARIIATRRPSSRLDPPLTVELNEAAHIAPLPNLPAYMGDSGGFSIALHVYLQSLSQARAKWGADEAMIMWDNAAVRIIMGGAGNIDDLEDVSRLMGEYERKKTTETVSRNLKAVATTTEPRRVLSAEEIRTLKFGTAVVVSRASRPVEVNLTPWWKRSDGKEIGAGKARTEKLIMEYGQEFRARVPYQTGPPSAAPLPVPPGGPGPAPWHDLKRAGR